MPFKVGDVVEVDYWAMPNERTRRSYRNWSAANNAYYFTVSSVAEYEELLGFIETSSARPNYHAPYFRLCAPPNTTKAMSRKIHHALQSGR